MNSFSKRGMSIALFASLGGFLFGYNMSVIAGALLSLEVLFELSAWEAGFLVSIVIIGALLGASCAGFLSDKWGRKKTFLLMTLFFLAGVFITSLGESFSTILIGRLITGVGIGLASVVTPLYLAEISPAESRGAFVTIYQLVITIGIFFAYFSDLIFIEENSWRYMFALGALPAIILLIALFFFPETPQWLYGNEKKKLARSVLEKLHTKNIDKQIKEMEALSRKKEKGDWKQIFSKKVGKILIIGVIISVLQQVTGINIVIFYAPKIFQSAGFSGSTGAILATVGVGAVNVIATIFSVWLMDRLGRRPLLLISLLGMLFSLIALSLSFFRDWPVLDTVSVISLMLYVLSFAIGMGPVVWVYISEIFPSAIRGRAMSICIFSNWFFNYFVSLTFLGLVDNIGSGWTFSLYAFITLIALGFVATKVKETKGKSLEELERSL